jgi:hypothetical protein
MRDNPFSHWEKAAPKGVERRPSFDGPWRGMRACRRPAIGVAQSTLAVLAVGRWNRGYEGNLRTTKD